ncbi:MAG: prevent-host-death protein [Bacteroidales bacterium]|nr:prevent-host-death protein [Bacteroidales bacterium]
MEVVSTRQFRDNMATYLKHITDGQELILKTRDKGSFVIRKVKEDDTLMTKEEFFAKIEESRKQIERGEYSVMHPDETLDEFLERVTNV